MFIAHSIVSDEQTQWNCQTFSNCEGYKIKQESPSTTTFFDNFLSSQYLTLYLIETPFDVANRADPDHAAL